MSNDCKYHPGQVTLTREYFVCKMCMDGWVTPYLEQHGSLRGDALHDRAYAAWRAEDFGLCCRYCGVRHVAGFWESPCQTTDGSCGGERAVAAWRAADLPGRDWPRIALYNDAVPPGARQGVDGVWRRPPVLGRDLIEDVEEVHQAALRAGVDGRECSGPCRRTLDSGYDCLACMARHHGVELTPARSDRILTAAEVLGIPECRPAPKRVRLWDVFAYAGDEIMQALQRFGAPCGEAVKGRNLRVIIEADAEEPAGLEEMAAQLQEAGISYAHLTRALAGPDGAVIGQAVYMEAAPCPDCKGSKIYQPLRGPAEDCRACGGSGRRT